VQKVIDDMFPSRLGQAIPIQTSRASKQPHLSLIRTVLIHPRVALRNQISQHALFREGRKLLNQMHDLLIRETHQGHPKSVSLRLMAHNYFRVGFLYIPRAVKNVVDKRRYVRERSVSNGDKPGESPILAVGERFNRGGKFS
jgi:hypothetical protein